MSQEAGEGAGERARATRARPQLPVVPVDSREQMAVMLAVHGRLLREYARHYLPGRGDEAVEDSVERTIMWLLAVPQPSLPHGLRYATKALWRECQRTDRRLRDEGVPTDRKLGPVTGDLAKAVERLGPRSRQVVMEAARGRTSSEIAQLQNTTPQAIRIRLYHARKRLRQFLAEGRLTASGMVLMSQGRMRGHRGGLLSLRHRGAPLVSWPVGDSLAQIATVTVAAVVCGVVFNAAVPPPLVGHGKAPPAQPAIRPQPAGPWRPPAVIADATVVRRGSHATRAAMRGDPQPGGAEHRSSQDVGLLLRAGDPSVETPEDTQLMAATAPADFASTHTILALGLGASCGCPVLFQSTDSGTTWTASPTAMPTGAEQLAVPPTYPADPRIFVGTNPLSVGSTFVIPRFGATPAPLPGPPGHLALAADFGLGDDRAFVAAQASVVAIPVDATPVAPVPVLLYPQWFGTASVATAPRGDGAAILALAPPGTAAVGNPGAGETQVVKLFACGPGTSCSVRSVPPPAAFNLTTSPSDVTTAVSWTTGVVISGDGGRTFGVSSTLQGNVMSVATNTGRAWVITGTGSSVRLFTASPGTPWTDRTGADGQLAHAFRLVAIPGGPVLAFLAGRGLRCTVDGGTTWHDRCP